VVRLVVTGGSLTRRPNKKNNVNNVRCYIFGSLAGNEEIVRLKTFLLFPQN